jgi:hypothetical protein
LPIDQVPDFIDEKDFYGSTARWLAKRGLTLIEIDLQQSTHWPFFWGKTVYTILSGQSPRGDWKHAVVGNGLNYVHDPHPDNKMIKGNIEYVYLIVPITCSIKEEEDVEDDDYSEGSPGIGQEHSNEDEVVHAPKRRGRKPGSKNKPKS